MSEFATFKGYAAIFNNVDLQGDIIDPGAFRRTVSHKGPTRPLLWSHDVAAPLGWIDVEEDTRGLRGTCRILTDLTKGKDAVKLISTGLITAMSIGFRLPEKSTEWDSNHFRHLKEIDLMETSLVLFPANQRALLDVPSSSPPPKANQHASLSERRDAAGNQVVHGLKSLSRLLERLEQEKQTTRRAGGELVPGLKFEFSESKQELADVREQLRNVTASLHTASEQKNEDEELRQAFARLLATLRT